MQINTDLPALFVALCAFLLTLREVRRSRSIHLRILKCDVGFGLSAGQAPQGWKLTIRMRNEGMSLHDPNMGLYFRSIAGTDRMCVPFKRKNSSNNSSEFSYGMIAEFYLAQVDIHDAFLPAFESLKNLSKQNAVIVTFSQGYEAKRIKLGSTKDHLVGRYNAIARRINSRFDKTSEWVYKPGRVLPGDLLNLSSSVTKYIQLIVSKHAENDLLGPGIIG